MRIKVCTALCGLLALCCALFFPREPQRVVRAQEYLSEERPDYQGVIEVWQVSTWRTAAMARSAALEQAAARFEAAHPGIYVEVEEVTQETLDQRLALGRMPDLFSLPGEVQAGEGPWMRWEERKLDPGWRQDWGEALPWMATAGILLLGEGEGAAGAQQWMQGFALDGLEVEAAVTQWDREAYNAFVQGKAATLYGGLWEEAALARREEAVAYQVYPWPEEALMPVQFQYLLAPEPKTEAMRAALEALAAELLGERTQKTVAERCGCLPMITPQPDWTLRQAARTAWERRQGDWYYRLPQSLGHGDKESFGIVRQGLQEGGAVE